MKIGGTDLPALFPSLAAPNVDPLLSPELQLCIKKLNKKDPITKTKVCKLSEIHFFNVYHTRYCFDVESMSFKDKNSKSTFN